ncbi:MAG: MoaD/ThiS family protein [Prochlorococcaceae cyanobacterium]|jgi:molybdopterin synthase sulfur carrier subunit
MDPDTASSPPQPPLRVRLFARLREQAGWGERTLALHTPGQPAPTAALVWQQLRLGPWPEGVRVAVNQEFAAPHQPLQPGDEVAFLPPITGG